MLKDIHRVFLVSWFKKTLRSVGDGTNLIVGPKTLHRTTAGTIQDFLYELGMRPSLHTVEIFIFFLYHVRPTKIVKDHLKERKFLIFKSHYSVEFFLIFLFEKY